MRRSVISQTAFSLVEVTLALGIAAFCLIAVFGLMPVGVQTNRNATSRTAATSIITAVVADLQVTPKTPGTWTGTSLQFHITLGSDTTLYFDGAGQASIALNGDSRYRLRITFPTTGNLTYANLKVTWPAPVDPATATPSGSEEIFATLDRH
jgi:uncharacterized protein (TIGR02598 family)